MVIFVVAVALVLALTGPVALVLVSLARRDIRRLEHENTELRTRMSRGGSLDVSPVDVPSATRMTAPISPAPPPDRKRRRDVESVIGGEWLTWIGIVTIFFGTAFFLAVELGEHVLAGAGQIAAALLVSVVFILAGLRLSPAGPRSILSHGLVGGGIALLFLIAYGSYGFHRLVSAPVVYVFLVGVTAVGAALALRRNAMSIALLTAVGALVTPLLLQTDADPARFLFPYTVLVVAGASHVGMRRRWPMLTVLAFAATALLLFVWCVAHWTRAFGGPDPHRLVDDASRGIALVSGLLLWVLFVTTPIVSAGRRRVWGTARDVVILLAGLSFGWFVFVLLEPRYELFRGLALALLAAAHVAASRVLGVRAGVDARSMLFYTGIALAVIAVPVQFDGSMTTLAWVMLGFVLLLSGVRRHRAANRALGFAVYLLVLGRLLVFDGYHAIVDSAHAHPILNASFLAGLVAVAVLLASAVLLHRNRGRLLPAERHVVPALVVSAAVALWWRGTAETVLFFETQRIAGGAAHVPTGRRILLAVSWVWAIYAALLIGGGFIARYRPLRLLGVVVIGFLVAKVFLFDIQALERGYRIASFVGVGALLLLISAAYQRDRKAS